MTLQSKKTCTTSINGVAYSATLETVILRPGLYEALPTSNYLVTLRAGEAVLGTGIWDGEALLTAARLAPEPALEARVFTALQRALAARASGASQ